MCYYVKNGFRTEYQVSDKHNTSCWWSRKHDMIRLVRWTRSSIETTVSLNYFTILNRMLVCVLTWERNMRSPHVLLMSFIAVEQTRSKLFRITTVFHYRFDALKIICHFHGVFMLMTDNGTIDFFFVCPKSNNELEYVL